MECFCGNECPPASNMTNQNECDKSCSGNPDQMCGGNWRLDVYNLVYNDKAEREENKTPALQTTSISVVLSSPEMQGQACFFFWHSMYGPNVETLSAYVAYGPEGYGELGELYFQKSGTQGPRWTETKMNIGNDHGNEPYKVRIEGLVDEQYAGEMSIDDVRFEVGNCFEDADHPWELCSFESVYEIHICGYESPEENELEWQLKTGDQEHQTDHTLSTGKGHYMAMDVTTESMNKKGRLVSPFYNPFDESKEYYCMQFFWLADVTSDNAGGARLNVRAYSGTPESHTDVLVSTVKLYHSAEQQISWKIGEAEIKPDDNFAMVFEMIAGNSNLSIGLDDIKILPGRCEIYNCDFEQDWCFWHNLKDDDADMIWYDNKQLGSYLYVDETSVTDTSKKFTYARIMSQEFPSTLDGQDACMTFYYYMQNENTTDRLSVAISGGGHERTLWEIRNTPGHWSWTQASVPISFTSGFYSIIIEAAIRSGNPGTIAVDTINFSTDSCEIQPSNALPYEYSEEKIDCSFDADICEFTTKSVDETRLDIVEKRPTLANSGPDAGQNSNFLFLDSIIFANKSVSLFSTPSAPPPHGFCVSFYYDMFGYGHPTIVLTLQMMKSRLVANDKDSQMLWARHGSQVDRWIRQEVNIPPMESNWRIMFDMIAGDNFGDIALDSLDLKRGPCVHTHDCDFELGTLCRWENVTGSEPGNITSAQHWNVLRGMDLIDSGLNYFPLIDHSAMSFDGYYLTVDMGSNAALYDKARFASQLFKENFGTQCLSFYWVFMGDTEINLNVHSFKGDPLTEGGILFEKVYKLESPEWRYSQVEVTEQDAFKVKGTILSKHDFHHFFLDCLRSYQAQGKLYRIPKPGRSIFGALTVPNTGVLRLFSGLMWLHNGGK